jgi:hypothetical protein
MSDTLTYQILAFLSESPCICISTPTTKNVMQFPTTYCDLPVSDSNSLLSNLFSKALNLRFPKLHTQTKEAKLQFPFTIGFRFLYTSRRQSKYISRTERYHAVQELNLVSIHFNVALLQGHFTSLHFGSTLIY